MIAGVYLASNLLRFAARSVWRGLLSSPSYAMPDHYKNRRGSDIEDSDDELFAELEAEIENDDNAAVRERGMEQLRKE